MTNIQVALHSSEELMAACHDLAKTFKPYAPIDKDMECISYPYPNNRNGISIMVRVKDEPTTMREVRIADSDWR